MIVPLFTRNCMNLFFIPTVDLEYHQVLFTCSSIITMIFSSLLHISSIPHPPPPCPKFAHRDLVDHEVTVFTHSNRTDAILLFHTRQMLLAVCICGYSLVSLTCPLPVMASYRYALQVTPPSSRIMYYGTMLQSCSFHFPPSFHPFLC